MFDREYDVVILGSGLKQAILSCALSSQGFKILHLEKSIFIGGECTPLAMEQIFPDSQVVDKFKFTVDPFPKHILHYGPEIALLTKIGMTAFLEYQRMGGIFTGTRKGNLFHIPLSKSLFGSTPMDFFSNQTKIKEFFSYCWDFNFERNETWKNINIEKVIFKDFLTKFGLVPSQIQFLIMGLGEYSEDTIFDRPAMLFLRKIQTLFECAKGTAGFPYLFPKYGMIQMIEAFIRIAIMNGVHFSVGHGDIQVVCDEETNILGVSTEGQFVNTTYIISAPTHLPRFCSVKMTCFRGVLLLNRAISTIENPKSVLNRFSGSFIFPPSLYNDAFSSAKSKEEIPLIVKRTPTYAVQLSSAHNVIVPGAGTSVFSPLSSTATLDTKPSTLSGSSKKGKSVLAGHDPSNLSFVVINGILESGDAEKEADFFSKFFGPVLDKKFGTYKYADRSKECPPRILITSTMDPSTNFRRDFRNIRDIYKVITGQEIDLETEPMLKPHSLSRSLSALYSRELEYEELKNKKLREHGQRRIRIERLKEIENMKKNEKEKEGLSDVGSSDDSFSGEEVEVI